ncbi:hypothetical protein LX36DRAFT_354398 [Colletotrichum falcatum]|nr:hypothetical protein LX36DRAFT_354398 [Colletotrichum falcatum]
MYMHAASHTSIIGDEDVQPAFGRMGKPPSLPQHTRRANPGACDGAPAPTATPGRYSFSVARLAATLVRKRTSRPRMPPTQKRCNGARLPKAAQARHMAPTVRCSDFVRLLPELRIRPARPPTPHRTFAHTGARTLG